MTADVIYFDNAATSFPKPEAVYQAQDVYLRRAANPGRAAHRLALASAREIFETRAAVAKFLGLTQPERLIFTPGCTHSLNFALKGIALKSGDTVVTSSMEHNAVMRPLQQLKEQIGINLMMLPYRAGTIIAPKELSEALERQQVRLCVFSETSNVTGEMLDLSAVSAVCRASGVPLAVDAAQSAGYVESSPESLGISLWCASGHKGMMGPPGVGLLYVAPEMDLRPLIAGGTGSGSESLSMPEYLPDCLEAGTAAGPAIAGLGAGVAWLQSTGLETIRQHRSCLSKRFLDWASRSDFITLFGASNPDRKPHPYGVETAGHTIARARTDPGASARNVSSALEPPNVQDQAPSTVSFSIAGVSADRVACLLDQNHGIAVRSGLHCAASAHRSLGTLSTGLVRASFGYFNTLPEVDKLCDSLERIAKGLSD